jgi:hypothetical protein
MYIILSKHNGLLRYWTGRHKYWGLYPGRAHRYATKRKAIAARERGIKSDMYPNTWRESYIVKETGDGERANEAG